MNKLVKYKADVNIRNKDVAQYIRLKDENYVLTPDEELLTDVELIEACHNYGIIDYRKKREVYKYFARTFSNQPEDIKDKICVYCATDQNTIIAHLMSKGMTLQQAIQQYIFYRSKDISEAAADCNTYITSDKFMNTLLFYLPLSEAERFLEAIKDLQFYYRTAAHFGTNYNNNKSGIMDFIEDTGDYVGKGLSTYTTYPGLNIQDLIKELKSILVDGNI